MRPRSVRRREFITLTAGMLAWPSVCRAQQAATRKIALVIGHRKDDPEAKAYRAAFSAGLVSLGWVEGTNIQVDYRFTEGNAERFSALAKEVISQQPEVIVAQSTPVVATLQRETRAIPIVFVSVSDPIGSGFVSSLARPGGNITGVIQYEPGIPGKWLAMLKEIAPSLTRVAAIANPKTTAYDYLVRNAIAAAVPLGIELIPTPIDNVGDLERSIDSFALKDNSGLLLLPDGFTIAHRSLVIASASKHRLPAVYAWRYFVMEGGLMSYGIDINDVFRQSTTYVDHILRGTNPADLPVQVPTKYETVLNLKTAKALGFSVPPSLLVRADEVIE